MAMVVKDDTSQRTSSVKTPKPKTLSKRLKKLLTPRSRSLEVLKSDSNTVQEEPGLTGTGDVKSNEGNQQVPSLEKDVAPLEIHVADADNIVEADEDTKTNDSFVGNVWNGLEIARSISEGSRISVTKIFTNLFDSEKANSEHGDQDLKPSNMVNSQPGELKINELNWLDKKNSTEVSRSSTPPITIKVDHITESTIISEVESDSIYNVVSSRSGSITSSSSKYESGISSPLSGTSLDPEVKKRNDEFHSNFPSFPQDEICLEDWYCALQKDILVSGRLYVTKERIVFHSNLFGWVNHTSIYFKDILNIKKRNTAFVIPNSIQIETLDQKYFFASFISRDATYYFIYNLWHKKCPNRATDQNFTNSDTETFDDSENENSSDSGITTLCSCLKSTGHSGTVNMDVIYPVNVENLFNLLFGSDIQFLIKHYSQSNTDVKIKEWNDNKRHITYIKPLSNSIGPKQTRCDINETILHQDFNDYCSLEIKTQNPDVPSGDAFTVVSKICLMTSRTHQCRMITSTTVEWSKSSWIKGPVESGVKDGTTKAAQELDRAIQAHLNANPNLVTKPVGAVKKEDQDLDLNLETTHTKNEPKMIHLLLKNRFKVGTFFILMSIFFLVTWTIRSSKMSSKLEPVRMVSSDILKEPLEGPLREPLKEPLSDTLNSQSDDKLLSDGLHHQLIHLRSLQSTLKVFQDHIHDLELSIIESHSRRNKKLT